MTKEVVIELKGTNYKFCFKTMYCKKYKEKSHILKTNIHVHTKRVHILKYFYVCEETP